MSASPVPCPRRCGTSTAPRVAVQREDGVRARALDAVVGVQRRERRGGHGADRHRAGVRVRPARGAGAALAAVWVTAFALYVATMANGDMPHRSAATSSLCCSRICSSCSAAAWRPSVPMGQSSFPGSRSRPSGSCSWSRPSSRGRHWADGARRRSPAAGRPWPSLTACLSGVSFPAPSSFRTERKGSSSAKKGSTSGQISGQERATKGPKGRAMDDRLMILRDVDAGLAPALVAPFASCARPKNTSFPVAFSSRASLRARFSSSSSVARCCWLPARAHVPRRIEGAQVGVRGAGGASRRGPKNPYRGGRSAEAARRRGRVRTGPRARESPPTRDETCGARDASLTRRRATIVASIASLAVFAFSGSAASRRRFPRCVVLPSPSATSPSRRRCTEPCSRARRSSPAPCPAGRGDAGVSAVAAAAAIGVPGWLWPGRRRGVGFDAFRRRRRRGGTRGASAGDGLRAVRVRRGGVRGSVPGGQLRQPKRRAGRNADPGPDPLPAAQRLFVSGRAGAALAASRRRGRRKSRRGLRRGAWFARADVRAVRGRVAQRHARGRDVHVPSVPGGDDHRPRIGRGGRPARAASSPRSPRGSARACTRRSCSCCSCRAKTRSCRACWWRSRSPAPRSAAAAAAATGPIRTRAASRRD